MKIDITGLSWHEDPENPGRYLDVDSFYHYDIVEGEHFATLLYNGIPMVIVDIEGETFEVPRITENYGQQVFAAFLADIGEADEDAAAFVCDHGIDALFESGKTGEGHELVDIVDRIIEGFHEND